jgi:integrating conjugative element protein (TIGR03752 family)
VWIEPLDRPTGETASPTRLSRAAQTAGGYLGRASTQTWETAVGARAAVTERQPEPAYTVPRNATLMGSMAMTALIGRVPVQGQVRDPMPFKVITGADNLAANGLTVPGVRGMTWSGTAVGDWTLSCVTGQLESVTFVFDDGTIRTLSRDDPALQASGQGGQGGQGRRDVPLGWISDAQGMPCITGERKTNAPAFLTQRIGVQAMQAAAEAAAAAETTAVIGNAGGVTGAVTGDVGRYVLGRTASGGSEEITQWLLERQSQSFDAVFVPAGADIAIHVDRELTIDWDPHGRKLDHAFNPTASQHALRHSPLD